MALKKLSKDINPLQAIFLQQVFIEPLIWFGIISINNHHKRRYQTTALGTCVIETIKKNMREAIPDVLRNTVRVGGLSSRYKLRSLK